MEAKKNLMLEGRGILIFCLICTATLPIALYSSAGYDDNYVSYWAAHSLTQFGELLNYNGERVEVSSSLLYVLVLALAHKLTSLSFSLLGGVLGIVFALLTVLQTYRLANLFSPAAGRLAALLLALNPLFLYWAVSGTESTLMSWLLVWSVFALAQLARLGFSTKALFWALLPLSGVQLVRPEGGAVILVALMGCWVFSWYQQRYQQPAASTFSKQSIAWVIALSVLVTVLILSWRFSYFGQWYPQPVNAKLSGFSVSIGALISEYRYFIETIAFRLGYVFYLFLFACVTIWVLMKIFRFPQQQSPVLWISSLFSWTYLCFIFISGGDWIVGQNGEWIIGARFFSHVAALMAVMIAIAVCALKERWMQYVFGAVLALSLLIPAAKIVGSESTGLPVHMGIEYADQIRQHSQASDMSWFDMANRIHMRDITLLSNLDRVIATVQPSLHRPVRLMSRQTGMVMHHVARNHFGNVLFADRRGLSDATLLDCEPSQNLKHRTIGLNLNYSHLFKNWNAYSRCIERPDIIYDILISPDEMHSLEENGYSVVYEQNGYQGYAGNRVQQHAFIAVRNELAPMLEAKHEYLNKEYWREGNARLFDPEYNTRFVVIGHGRGLLEGHLDVLDEFVDLINLSRPQYVFVLGDFVRLSSDEEWDLLEKHMFERLDAPVIFVPGNHETRSNAAGDDSVYRRRMAPFPDVITTRYVNFVFLSSSLRLPEITQKLKEAFAKCEEGKPTILVTHHEVWKFGPPTSRHMPTFSSQQFLPLIDGKVDAIIAGDGYGLFREEATPIGVPAYRTGIGMKGHYARLFFSIGDIGPDGDLDLRPFEVSLNPYHDWYRVAEPEPSLPYLLKNAPPIGFD